MASLNQSFAPSSSIVGATRGFRGNNTVLVSVEKDGFHVVDSFQFVPVLSWTIRPSTEITCAAVHVPRAHRIAAVISSSVVVSWAEDDTRVIDKVEKCDLSSRVLAIVPIPESPCIACLLAPKPKDSKSFLKVAIVDVSVSQTGVVGVVRIVELPTLPYKEFFSGELRLVEMLDTSTLLIATELHIITVSLKEDSVGAVVCQGTQLLGSDSGVKRDKGAESKASDVAPQAAAADSTRKRKTAKDKKQKVEAPAAVSILSVAWNPSSKCLSVLYSNHRWIVLHLSSSAYELFENGGESITRILEAKLYSPSVTGIGGRGVDKVVSVWTSPHFVAFVTPRHASLWDVSYGVLHDSLKWARADMSGLLNAFLVTPVNQGDGASVPFVLHVSTRAFRKMELSIPGAVTLASVLGKGLDALEVSPAVVASSKSEAELLVILSKKSTHSDPRVLHDIITVSLDRRYGKIIEYLIKHRLISMRTSPRLLDYLLSLDSARGRKLATGFHVSRRYLSRASGTDTDGDDEDDADFGASQYLTRFNLLNLYARFIGDMTEAQLVQCVRRTIQSLLQCTSETVEARFKTLDVLLTKCKFSVDVLATAHDGACLLTADEVRIVFARILKQLHKYLGADKENSGGDADESQPPTPIRTLDGKVLGGTPRRSTQVMDDQAVAQYADWCCVLMDTHSTVITLRSDMRQAARALRVLTTNYVNFCQQVEPLMGAILHIQSTIPPTSSESSASPSDPHRRRDAVVEPRIDKYAVEVLQF
eukprot:ANDGO_03738.mRNA.1 hypothetical protein